MLRSSSSVHRCRQTASARSPEPSTCSEDRHPERRAFVPADQRPNTLVTFHVDPQHRIDRPAARPAACFDLHGIACPVDLSSASFVTRMTKQRNSSVYQNYHNLQNTKQGFDLPYCFADAKAEFPESSILCLLLCCRARCKSSIVIRPAGFRGRAYVRFSPNKYVRLQEIPVLLSQI